MRKVFTLLSTLIVLTACSPEKLLQMAEKKGAKVTTDTVFQERLVYVPSVTHDTTFTSLPGDTVTITKDRLQVKYVRLPGDKVYIQGTCLPDTIKISVPVEVTRTISAGYSKWQMIGAVFGGIFFVGVMAFGAYKLAELIKRGNGGPA